MRFEVLVGSGTDRRPSGIRTHRYRGLNHRDVTVHFGIRVTSPALTVLHCAPRLDERARRRVVNDALHSRYLRDDALFDVRRRFAHHPGAKLLEPFLGQRGITRSPLEDDFCAFCARFGLPEPQTNVRVAGHVVDALFAEQLVIVEVDSWDYHGDRQAFETDRDRDADTLRAGFVTVRVTSERMRDARAEAEAERLRAILAQRGRGGGRG